MITGGILKRSEEDGVPGVVPVSDASDSSGASELTHSLDSVVHVKSEPYRRPADQKKRVSFDSIGVQKYSFILGDHPDCAMGPPVSITQT